MNEMVYQWHNFPTRKEVLNNEGFVYLIYNTEEDKVYVGKKSFWKGKGKKRVESNWKRYWGSSKKVHADIKRLGKSKFMRWILWICPSKAELSYLELKEQINYNAFESVKCYNEMLYIKVPCLKKPLQSVRKRTKYR